MARGHHAAPLGHGGFALPAGLHLGRLAAAAGRVRGRRGGETLLVRCAWCGRVAVGGRFVRRAGALRGRGPTEPPTTDGICPECLDRENLAAASARARRGREAD